MNGFDTARFLSRLDPRLTITDIRPVCHGMARGTQVLTMGDDTVCTDEVLVEEITYTLADEMDAEMNSLPIKIGMLSPFTGRSTYPPKYFVTERSTVWLITSVPPVSLALILDEVARRFPAHYTWDRPAYLRDILGAVFEGCRDAWQLRRKPFAAVKAGVRKALAEMPSRITPRERLAFAALLVDAIRAKHAAGIHHDNISPHTVFFSDCVTPKLLCNYGGTVPSLMAGSVPDEILHQRRETTFGPQSCDTYALALIVYELITGVRLQGDRFELDPCTAVVVPKSLQRRFAGRGAFLNPLIRIARDTYVTWMRSVNALQAVFNESRLAGFRRLTRASGSFVRSIPLVRTALDLAGPTEIAWVLRSILDRQYNQRAFGTSARINRSAPVKRNANTAYLRGALPAAPLRRDSRLARVIQEIIDRAHARPSVAVEDEVTTMRRGSGLGRPYLIRCGVTAAMLLVLCVSSSTHDRQEAPATDPTRADSTAILRQQSRCPARLVQNVKHPGVYRLTDMRRRCGLGAVAIPNAGLDSALPPSLGETYARFYLASAGDSGYAAPIAVCRCPSAGRGCEPGQFYRTVGLSGLGEKVVFAEGDVIAFEDGTIEAFMASLGEPPKD